MKKIICSPGCYVQGKDELANLAEYYKMLGSKGAYLIIDRFIYNNYLNEIESSFIEAGIRHISVIFGGECCMEEIDQHKDALDGCDVIVGIGGGKTLDTTKAVGYYTNLPVMIVPTAASTDAPCSRLAVVYKKSGEFSNYLPLTSNPNIVVMDTAVIAKAPVRFLMAGIGDALATYYEAAACEKASVITMAGGHATKASMALAKLCLDTLLEDGLKAKAAVEQDVCTQALENIVEANTYLSGVGFESSGLAAAHAIHNGLTVLEETHRFLHGEKVAFGAVTQLVLENRPMDEITSIIRFCKACGLPTNLKDLGIDQVGDEKLLEAAKLSCAPDDTMGNMPFEVSPEDVLAAMKTADAISRTIMQ